MYQWKANARIILYAWMGCLNLCILRMLEDTISLDAAYMIKMLYDRVQALRLIQSRLTALLSALITQRLVGL